MTKKLCFSLFLFFGFLAFAFGADKQKITKKHEYPLVIEQEPHSLHKIITCNGEIFLEAGLKVDDGTTFPFIFLLDTGSTSSHIIMEDGSSLWDYFNTQIDGTRFLIASMDFYTFTVENFYLDNFRNAPVDLKELKLIFNDKKYYFGILGNDVLMNKSLLLSISNGYFEWTDENPFRNSDSVVCPKVDSICSTRNGNDFYIYSIYTEDNCFKSDALDNPIFGFFNSPDKSKSRYIIDTGTYYIATSNLDLFYQIKNRNLESYTYNTEIAQKLGYANVRSPVFLDTKFESLQVMSGGTPEMSKCFGNQILAAFDIYFDKENCNRVQKIYFSPADEESYKMYRADNDSSYYYPAATFGFRTSYSRITEKAFVHGKEMLKTAEIGDTVISINDIPYEQVKEWSLPDKIEIKLKKKNGKIIKINARRYYLR